MKLLSSFETCGKYGSVKLYINGELPGSISDEDIYDIFYNVLPKVNVKIQDKLMSKDIELLKMFEDEIKELENHTLSYLDTDSNYDNLKVLIKKDISYKEN